MAKVNLPSVVSGYNLQKINDNDQTLATELNENVLYRRSPKGEPNEMHNNLDMNSNRIYNLPSPGLDHEPVTLKDINDLIANNGDQTEAKYIQYDPYGFTTSENVQGALYQIVDEIASLEDSLQGKVFYTPEDFGAIGDGVVDDTDAVNAALEAASTDGLFQVVLKGDSVYLCSNIISVPEDVKVYGNGVATLYMADSYPVNNFVEMGDRSSLYQVVVDGNRDNNPDNNNRVLVRIGDADEVVVDKCRIVNSSGYCVVSNGGIKSTVTRCVLSNFYMHAVAVYAGPPNRVCYHTFSDNRISEVGWGAFIIGNCDHFRVEDNWIEGRLIGQRNNRTTANLSGNTVTWASGATFAGAKSGNFVVANNGQEFRIVSVNSPTSLTVEETLPTLSGTQISVGPGDMIGIIASNFGYIERNTITGCATFGMGFSLGGNDQQCSNNTMSENKIHLAGKNAINVSYDGGTGFLENNSIIGNKIYNAGFAGGIGSLDRIAILIYDGTGGKVVNTLLDDNTAISFSGEGQTTYWLGFSNEMTEGSVRVGCNVALGLAESTVYNDVKAVDLSGWGATATVTNISSYGDSVRFTVNTSGGSQTSDPAFNVRKVCEGAGVSAFLLAQVATVSGGVTLSHIWGTQATTKGNWRGNYAGTPANNGTVTIVVKG